MADISAAISPLAPHLMEMYPHADWPQLDAPGASGWMARHFADAGREFHALLSTATVSGPVHCSLLSVRGGDQVRWLNGMITNTIKDLLPGHSNYSFVLNAQGRILGDLTAYRFPDHIVLATD